ncbi:LysR family transcriptional regulator [Corynebacterium sp. CCM 9185]|uniref:LysR family transcriptional regulator n=1 Tax=Corynebacterium marambiense TaxID=2765364 RepID=A0ABS0VTH6_9CORY|nr:LysR family transcriptional regulator [Corynebacterium marambiense]MBI9000073.1 LysR family transcriptional regulator [Corynebacterium marambiense]MCK7663425.1 LysR family transcriptional regulator [Corynebacterium marambiense]MCX7542141.1 LysR family transcriptional regulator [Corynebacterium marambiense]
MNLRSSEPALSISFVTGTAPGKWFDRFGERTGHREPVTGESIDPMAELIDGQADLVLVRLPDPRIDDTYHLVRLYEEEPGIAVPKDSELSLVDTLGRGDISDQTVFYTPDVDGRVDVRAVGEAVDVVATGVGVVLAPRPLLRRLGSRRTENRGYRDGSPTTIALVWRVLDDCDVIQDFVGVARGRTGASSRTAQPKRTASEKAAAKKVRRAATEGVPRRKPVGRGGTGAARRRGRR